MFIFVTDTVLS